MPKAELEAEAVKGALVTWRGADGHKVRLFMYQSYEGDWQAAPAYEKLGLSRSDDEYGVVYALPYGYEPTEDLIAAALGARV